MSAKASGNRIFRNGTDVSGPFAAAPRRRPSTSIRKSAMAPRIAIVSTAHIHTIDYCKDIARECGAPHVIWDDDEARGRSYAEKFNSRFEPDLGKVLADPAVDGFAVCSENARHTPLLRRVIPVGKPTFCEKPLAVDPAEADDVAALVAKHGTPFTCGYIRAFTAPNRSSLAFAESGGLGTPHHWIYRNAHHGAYGRWFDNPDLKWFVDPALSGGGAMMDICTHGLHLLRLYAGPVAAVRASVANLSGAWPQVEDWAMVELRFASGAIGRVEGAWCFPAAPLGLEIVGSKRTLYRVGDEVVCRGPDEEPRPVPTVEGRPYRMGRLFALVRGELSKDEIDRDLEAAVAAVHLMDAAFRSARGNGGWIEIKA